MKKYKYRKWFTFEGKQYSVRGNSLIEIGQKMALKLEQLKHDSAVLSGDTSVEKWTYRAIDTYKTNIADSTRKTFTNRVQSCILDKIGNRSIKSIRSLELQELLNAQTGYSKTQINEVYYAIKFIFKTAYNNNIIESDPSERLTKPAAKPRETRRALTATERKYFIEVGKTDRRYFLFLLMLFCGCRPSESAECKGSDINGQLLHIRGRKTAFSDRYVPIPSELYELIKNTPATEYIAPTSTGHIITPAMRGRIWHAYTRDINIAMGAKMYRNKLLPPLPLAADLVPYCLRHEYCTELARKGIDIRIAQKLMGHSDISMTANIYTNLQHMDYDGVLKQLER